MIAAENDAIKGAKVGGMADVIRDLPLALAGVDINVDVAMPNYGFIAKQQQATLVGEVVVKFGANSEKVVLWQVSLPIKAANSTKINNQVFLFDHPLFNGPNNQVYCNGSSERPFAEDASKFALFNLAVAQAYVDGLLGRVDYLHMHDWHTGFLVMLRAFATEYKTLKDIRCVFSIHNLAIQGIRPIRDDVSSFCAWYPDLARQLTHEQKLQITDPRYPECINPMRMGIELSDKVHLVSPSYATEVLLPSDHQNGFFGGEGLEQSLQDKHQRGDVVGILNGCVYDDSSVELDSQPAFIQIEASAQRALIRWMGQSQWVKSVDQIALSRLQLLSMKNSYDHRAITTSSDAVTVDFVMTSVGRLTDQKVLLLRQPHHEYGSTLEAILIQLNIHKPNGIFVLLGSGDEKIAQEFQVIAAKYDNFVFLNGYDDALSQVLYKQGDLFIMPSSFEPCGISQLLAMKSAQVCIAHSVGGLKDTIIHKKNGWLFEGQGLAEQSQQLIEVVVSALSLHTNDLLQYKKMRQSAADVRFDWHSVAQQYKDKLYQ